uniref:AlNc14C358G10969 protein n=1 Tax=Albugo laibachii Nc14 TaxID=890382 RepID=F0WXL9_9STRA|nr:AlNc14C358G10969 [Albugo laibachii Nc14]|eukprot:CCA26213.1 AlNc14C358G10969 [Albugo laibachii Nc14]
MHPEIQNTQRNKSDKDKTYLYPFRHPIYHLIAWKRSADQSFVVVEVAAIFVIVRLGICVAIEPSTG